jgi:serine protease
MGLAATGGALLGIQGGSAAAIAAPARVRLTRARGSDGYIPGVVVVGFQQQARPTARIATARAAGALPVRDASQEAAAVRVLHLRAGITISSAIARLKSSRDVSWAVRDYVAHATTVGDTGAATSPTERTGTELTEQSPGLAPTFVPVNVGNGKSAGEWQNLQWNFAGPNSVNAEQAWGNVIADHGEGGHGVVVAVLDTGIAYRDWEQYRRSPGFNASQFVRGYDFVDPNSPPVDRNGHGTFVAGEIAEETNVAYGLTGLAYGARLMPVRVLDSAGEGDAVTIAKGIRFAVEHHANIINLSLEFPATISAANVPELIQALRFAYSRHVLVVAAAGNDSDEAIPYPARAPGVLAVGATTEHGCLADYSNFGRHISIVAPGGGPDANLPGDPNCHPEAAPGRDVFQVTYLGSTQGRFGLPSGYEGTSMATPEVAATAALVIASGVLGRNPTPRDLAARLKATTRPLGGPSDRNVYGAGLLNAAAATAPGGPGAIAASKGP